MIGSVKIENIKMDYCCFGHGKKTLVILPGLSVNQVSPACDAIEGIFRIFTDDYTVYLFDRRSDEPEGYTTEQMADDTVKVTDKLGIKKFDLYGTSQGGMIALAIAVKYKDRVGKLAVCSTSSKPNETTDKSIGMWLELARKGLTDELNENMIDIIYSENSLRKYRSMLLSAGGEITKDKMKRFITIASPIITFDIYDRLNEITAETFVIGCEGDKVLSGPASVEIARKLGCRLYMYGPEYGHAVYDEAPDYTERLFEFYKGRND